jgi:hypothetical protein
MVSSPTPQRTELLAIAIFAIVLRLGVFITGMFAAPMTLADYTSKGDTTSYIAVAAAMTGERSLQSLDDYDRRVFPGYPAMIAVVHLARVPLPIAALCVTWISAGVAAAAAARVFADARVGWAMTCLIPHYLINSSLGMSEAPLLGVVCLALVLSQGNRIFFAGVLLGFAALIRPMALFPLIGIIFLLLRERRWARMILLCVGFAATSVAGFWAMQMWTGDALHGIHVYANHPGAYAGHMVVWPLQALLAARDQTIPRILYIWLHVIITLFATADGAPVHPIGATPSVSPGCCATPQWSCASAHHGGLHIFRASPSLPPRRCSGRCENGCRESVSCGI